MALTPEELLKKGLKELGLEIDGKTVSALMAYLSELKRWNKAYNLTAVTRDEDIVIKHFLDSALYLPAIEGRGSRVADVGSGAGFPGLVLKILRPGLSMTLIEPSGKKAAFLRHMTRTLALEEKTPVIEERVEGVKGQPLFDIALTRALFKAGEFVKKASGIVKKGGYFIMSKGPAYEKELAGLTAPVEIMPAGLPLTEITRYIIIMKNE